MLSWYLLYYENRFYYHIRHVLCVENADGLSCLLVVCSCCFEVVSFPLGLSLAFPFLILSMAKDFCFFFLPPADVGVCALHGDLLWVKSLVHLSSCASHHPPFLLYFLCFPPHGFRRGFLRDSHHVRQHSAHSPS